MEKTIEIPEGYEARIEGNKVILEPKESEDERIRTRLIALVEAFGQGTYKDEMLAYLERQKEQKPESCDCSRDEESYTNGIHHVLMNPEAYGLIKQKPAEWSEEDEEMIARICANLEYLIKEAGCDSKLKEKLEERIKWMKRLKSLRDNYKKCNSRWNPSEEQMAALLNDEYMQEQPEVDLEKFTEKIKTFQGRYKHPENISVKGAMAFMARMFYQYPNVARQWYDSLPKAIMDDARKEE